MNITNSEINIISSKDLDIRLKAFEFEKHLKKFFTLPQIIPMPDDFHPEAPRIIFSTPHGHSTLTISQVNFSLKTRYDGDFTENLNKCIEYLDERINLVFSMLKESRITLYYIGVIFNFEIPFTQKNNPVVALSQKFLNYKLNFINSLFDVSFKFTTCYDNTFYKNLIFKNYRRYQKKSIPKPSPAFLDLEEEGIQVQADINDRFAFNINKDYETNEEVLSKIYDILKNAYEEIPKMMEN
ncbi:MAG: hypothetical protein ACE5JB_00700 [bacterium]